MLPIAELVIAVLLIPAATAAWGALLALILLVVFIAGISYSLSRGRKFDCHCFGQLTTSEIGLPTLIRNGVLAVLAAFVAYSGFVNGNPGLALTDVFGGLSAFEWIMLVIGVILLAAWPVSPGCSSISSVKTGACSSGSTGSRPRSKTRTSRSRTMTRTTKTTKMRKKRARLWRSRSSVQPVRSLRGDDDARRTTFGREARAVAVYRSQLRTVQRDDGRRRQVAA